MTGALDDGNRKAAAASGAAIVAGIAAGRIGRSGVSALFIILLDKDVDMVGYVWCSFCEASCEKMDVEIFFWQDLSFAGIGTCVQVRDFATPPT